MNQKSKNYQLNILDTSDSVLKELKDLDVPGLEELSDKIAILLEGTNVSTEERVVADGLITLLDENISSDKFDDVLLKLGRFFLEKGKLTITSEISNYLLLKTKSKLFSAEAHLLLADKSIRNADWENAEKHIDEAKKHFAASDNPDGTAKCFNLLGILHGEKGEINDAIECFDASLDLLKSSDNDKLLAEVETNIAITENIRGNYTQAKNHFTNALKHFENIGDKRKMSELHHNIGMMLIAQKDYESALVELDEAIGLAVKGKHITTLAISYLGKSEALLNLGKIKEALEFSRKAMDIAVAIEDKLTMADVYRVIGSLEKKLHHYDTAKMYLDISLRLNKNLGNKLNIAETASLLAELYDETNNREESIFWHKSALEYYSEINAINKIKKIEEKLQTLVN